MMRRATLFTLSLVTLAPTLLIASAPVNPRLLEARAVDAQMSRFITAVTEGDDQTLSSLIAPNHAELRAALLNTVGKGFDYTFELKEIPRFEPAYIELVGATSARGTGWYMEGFNHRFVWEKIQGQWLLTHADLADKLSRSYLTRFAIIACLISLVASIFWLWMMIDAIQNKRWKWVVFLVLFNLLAALLYLIVVKKGSLRLSKPNA